LPEDGNTASFQKIASLKNQMDKIQKNKMMTVNISHDLFSLSYTCDNLAMQDLV
jgi:hypothetical protein